MISNRTRMSVVGRAPTIALAVGAMSALAACSGSATSPSASASAIVSAAPTVTPSPEPRGSGFPIFSATGPMAHARGSAAALLVGDGRVLVIGGDTSREGSPATATVELYDPTSGTFVSTGQMKAGRLGAAVALLHDGRVLVVGGHDGQEMLRSAEIYDPATGKFDLTGSPLADRQDGAAVTLSDGRVLVVGGYANPWDGTYTKAEIYDPATGKFSATGPTAVERLDFSTTLLRDGRVLIAGGTVPSRGDPAGYREATATAEIYDPETGKFSATGPMAATRHEHTATLLPDGLVLTAGGYGSDDASLDSAELYDPATGEFSATAPMGCPRGSHTATLLADGLVLVAGGWEFIRHPDASGGDVSELVLSSTELYDPVTGSFEDGMGMTMARFNHTSILLQSGSVLVLGGEGGSAARLISLASAELAIP